jgi:3-hydroxy-9,10-secoandrosta-1,3,5(10)-triene-9,17-dione monooxygenase reductase component
MTTSPTTRWAPGRRCTEALPPGAGTLCDALGRFATGVAFVTAAPAGMPMGLIVSSLTSVSLNPPLVSFCPSRGSLTWTRMRHADGLGINILGRRHEPFVRRAAPPGADRFAGVDWQHVHGVPLLADALAAIQCQITAEHPAGDHWIVVAAVETVRVGRVEDPLLRFAGAFKTLAA